MRRIRFKARSLKKGEMIEGYYAHQHLANFDADGQHIIDYDEPAQGGNSGGNNGGNQQGGGSQDTGGGLEP